MPRATILFSGPDPPGVVARLSGFFYDLGLNILEASNYTDLHGERGARFYMRLVVDLTAATTRATMESTFATQLAQPNSGEWSIGYDDRVARIAILCTKDPTCLYD